MAATPDRLATSSDAPVEGIICIAVLRIRMFLGLLDPVPLVRGTDPDPDPSIIKQKKARTILIPYVVTSL
jgi:hypothetical protein